MTIVILLLSRFARVFVIACTLLLVLSYVQAHSVLGLSGLSGIYFQRRIG